MRVASAWQGSACSRSHRQGVTGKAWRQHAAPTCEEQRSPKARPQDHPSLGADAIADSFYRSFELPITIVRPFNTFGPRQSARAVIPTIISQLLNTASPLWDKLKTRPSMSVAEELANTLLKIGEKYKSNIIISLSNEINLNVSNFDLEKLMISIKKYPDLLLQYKELLKK